VTDLFVILLLRLSIRELENRCCLYRTWTARPRHHDCQAYQ